MKISGIYKIESKLKSERFYIGSATNIEFRWLNHLCNLRKNKHHSIKLQRHYNKYGESDLQFSILLGCNKEDLIKVEQYFIDSYNPWFNICKKAGNQFGIKRSKKTLKKMSESHKGQTPWLKGKKLSEEAKKRISNTAKERYKTEKNPMYGVHILGDKHWNYGRKASIETKQKMSKSRIGKKLYPLSEEHKKKISESLKGRSPWNKGKTILDKICIN